MSAVIPGDARLVKQFRESPSTPTPHTEEKTVSDAEFEKFLARCEAFYTETDKLLAEADRLFEQLAESQD